MILPRHLLRAVLVGAVLSLAAALTAAETETKKAYDLAPGDAATTLKQFSAISGRETLFAAAAVRGVKTSPVKGTLSAQEAMDALLTETGLVAVRDEKTGAFSIRRETPEDAKNVSSRRAEAETAKKSDLVKLGDFEVTGSRIRGLVSQASIAPVMNISRQDIERAGVTSLGELSRLIPQAYSQNSYDGIGFGGQQQGNGPTADGSGANAVSTSRTTFNLRGLGSQNTLVMINGRRVARNGVMRGNDAADLSGIPVSSIERVEVLLGGASAIYGSDAVGGVINIILRRNYAGGELATSYENTFASDTAVRTATLSYGVTRGKWELQLSASAQDRNAFAAVDREFSATDNWTLLGGTAFGGSFAAGGFATGAGFVQAVSGNLPGRTSPYALIPDNAGATPLPASAYLSVVGNSTGVPAYTGDRAKYVNLIAPQRNESASLRANYRITSDHDLYLEARYSASETDIEGMPVNYRNMIGITNALQSAPIPADYPGNPFGVPVRLVKTFWELPPIQGSKRAITENTSLATGLRGSLPFGDWRYDAGFDWNRAYLDNQDEAAPGLNADAYNALIATRSLVLFYDSRTQQPNDLNVLRSLLPDAGASERNTNGTFAASADGSLWELPAGPIRLAVGGEYRSERARTAMVVPDDPRVNIALFGSFKRDAQAAFAETRIPVFSEKQHLPLLHSLEASIAARYDTYSDTGGATSPGYGLIWRPVKWTILRASRNHAFRAPGLNALYRPVTNSAFSPPSLAQSPIDPLRGNTPLPLGTYTTLSGGSLDLKPEKSISDNLGLVIESPFALLKGLSVSVDYQLLDYTDRLSSLSTQQIFDFFPERITRGANLPGDLPGWAGIPTLIDGRSANIARLEVETIDYQVSYRRSTSWGEFDARLMMTDYLKYRATSVPGAVPTSTLNQFPSRLSWQTYYTKGPYGFGVSGFYQEKQYLNLTYTVPRWLSAIEWNVQVAYDFDRRSGGAARNDTRTKRWLFAGTKLSFTVNNVFDREPPHVQGQGQAGFGVTDPRMARYVIALRKAF